MERLQAQAKIIKIMKNNAKVDSKQSEVIAKELGERWKGKSKDKTFPALLLELNKMDDNKITKMLVFAKIINKFKPNITKKAGAL